MPYRLPPLNALRAFEAAARHMSFQKAAGELHVTPAALSYQIRQLEDYLGRKLFKRLNRAVELTPDGAVLAAGVRDGFDRLKQAVAALNQRRTGNVLVISAGPAFTAKWLTPRLYRFIAAWPDIDARIAASIRLADLHRDDVDIVVRFGRGTYAGCVSTKLLDEYVTPLCAPSLITGAHPLRSPADLAHHTLIHDETHVGVFDLPDWRRWLAEAGVSNVDPARSGLHFNVADHAIDAAVAGAGVVLGRMVLADADIKAGRLVQPFPLKLKADYAFYVVTLESRIDEPAITAFHDWIFAEAEGEGAAETPGPPV
jgi:LysR family glycine cleavage system transcriptional activator